MCHRGEVLPAVPSAVEKRIVNGKAIGHMIAAGSLTIAHTSTIPTPSETW